MIKIIARLCFSFFLARMVRISESNLTPFRHSIGLKNWMTIHKDYLGLFHEITQTQRWLLIDFEKIWWLHLIPRRAYLT